MALGERTHTTEPQRTSAPNESRSPGRVAARLGPWHRRLGDSGLDLLGLVGLVAIWWALTHIVSRTSLPTPEAVAERIVHDFLGAPALTIYGLGTTSLVGNLAYTVENVVLGVAIGAAIGITVGLMAARVLWLRAIVHPIVTTLGTVPILVAAPFFLIWFGVGRMPALLLVAGYTAVILVIFSERAAENLNPVYEQAALTSGANRARILWDLFPGTIPEILGGIRIALGGGWGLEAIAELLGSNKGIGKVVELYSTNFEAEGIMAAIMLLSVVAILFDFIVVVSARQILRWRVAT